MNRYQRRRSFRELAVTYDIETFPNVFTLSAMRHRDPSSMFTWEISYRRNDLALLMQWFNWLHGEQVDMIGFNSLNFDYPVIHQIFSNPSATTVASIYAKAQSIIQGGDRFGHQIWQSDRFAPQIDLFKIHHFDNVAKVQSLKGLEFNMRSASIEDMPVEVGTFLNDEQIDNQLIPYNRHDVTETDNFAIISTPNLEFRELAAETLAGDVMNFNDTKIGKETLAQRLGDDLCYTFETTPSGYKKNKQPRQTPRAQIVLSEIIFPYIHFKQPEFVRVLSWLKEQVIVETKGVFADVTATINGFTFQFGTGGIHGSVAAGKIVQTQDTPICDVDVASLYPSIAIVNRLYPEHLGEKFIIEYANLKVERFKHKKGTVLNAMFKLALNGTWGDSNQPHSVFLDPQFAMTISINGQLLLCMLAEWLMEIPTFEMIQINTDGITFKIHASMEWLVDETCKRWEKFTMLELEHAKYARMFIRDVNNYIAEDTKGKRKSKGAYWYPFNFPDDISNASPSAWHKDFSSLVVQRAAEAAMLYGIDPTDFVAMHTDPFDFMLRAKVPRGSDLYIGPNKVQRITRYYIANVGGPLRKISPPTGEPGTWKRKSKVSDYEYLQIVKSLPVGQWDERIHTANKSKYEDREISFNAGWLVTECNNMASFDWTNLNRAWYAEEARKLIIQ